MRTAPVFGPRRAFELWVLALLALIAGCEILPVDEIDRCGGSNPPEDCTCADDEAEMTMDLGVRSASCPECLQSPRHPDCAGGDPLTVGDAGEGGAGESGADAGTSTGVAGKAAAGSGSTSMAGAGGARSSAGQGGSNAAGAGNAASCASCGDGERCVDGACAECGEDAHCTAGSRRHCDRETLTCVECLSHTDCGEADASQCRDGRCVPCRSNSHCAGVEGQPYCIAAQGVCVECRRHGDCQAEGEPQCEGGKCVPCTGDAACAGRAGRTVCDEGANSDTRGQCVECTGTKIAPCHRDETEYVCNSREHTCDATQVAGTLDVCAACVSDAACKGNALCMPMTFGGSEELGTFCLEPETDHDNDCITNDVYLGTEDEWTSVDGVSASVCIPPLTTCQAVNDFGRDCSGTGEEGDAECGAEGIDDGICRPYGPVFRCSYPCTQYDHCAERCEPLQSGGRQSCTFP